VDDEVDALRAEPLRARDGVLVSARLVLEKGVLGGLALVARSYGLVVLLLGINLALPLMIAIPLRGALESALEHRDAAANMMYGFDHAFWQEWSEGQKGVATTFGPDIAGAGFVFRNWDLALRGALPFPLRRAGEDGPSLNAVVAGVGVLYLLLQTFLAGGILAVFRAPRGSWSVRGLLHGSGFYFGRFFRLAVIVLVVDAALLRLDGALEPSLHRLAASSASEAVALSWSLGHAAVLALLLLAVHMVSGYAKVITVLEERTSAVLAFVSALGFCLSRLGRTTGQYVAILVLGFLSLAVWRLGDRSFAATGYTSQILVFAWSQVLVSARLFLRLGLLGGQMEIFRSAPGTR
jgi:hypothetical protein